MKEISKFAGPLGNGISTDLLDFENINKIPAEAIKELNITKQDQEYFSGAKKTIFTGKREVKVQQSLLSL